MPGQDLKSRAQRVRFSESKRLAGHLNIGAAVPLLRESRSGADSQGAGRGWRRAPGPAGPASRCAGGPGTRASLQSGSSNPGASRGLASLAAAGRPQGCGSAGWRPGPPKAPRVRPFDDLAGHLGTSSPSFGRGAHSPSMAVRGGQGRSPAGSQADGQRASQRAAAPAQGPGLTKHPCAGSPARGGPQPEVATTQFRPAQTQRQVVASSECNQSHRASFKVFLHPRWKFPKKGRRPRWLTCMGAQMDEAPALADMHGGPRWTRLTCPDEGAPPPPEWPP